MKHRSFLKLTRLPNGKILGMVLEVEGYEDAGIWIATNGIMIVPHRGEEKSARAAYRWLKRVGSNRLVDLPDNWMLNR